MHYFSLKILNYIEEKLLFIETYNALRRIMAKSLGITALSILHPLTKKSGFDANSIKHSKAFLHNVVSFESK